MSKLGTILGGALLCIALTGCENFLTGDEAKDNIKREIDYANAPSYTIYVVADRDCGQIRKPITGELKKKVTDTFDLKFEPADDYTFVRWEASSEELPEGANIKDYITFEEQGNPETKATFIKALDSIVITAVCPHLPSFDYTITGSNGKFSPSKGTYTCTQSYTYQLAFEPDTDYEFIKWEIYDSVTGEAIPNGLYLEIADLRNENTTIVLNQAPADPDLKITVRHVVTERPQILSNSPLYDAEGVYKDSRIQLVFDYDIDESCIYYTEEEMKTMLADRTADEGLFHKIAKNGEYVYYGYKKDNKTFFKNILIKDNQKGTNYNEYFNHPVFETSRILYVSADIDKELPDFSEVLVTVEKNFTYMQDDKPISLAGSKKWIYQTNNSKDSTPPEVVNASTNFKVGFSDTDLIQASDSASVETNPWKNIKYMDKTNKNLFLNLEIKDTGSGPASTFILLLNQVYGKNYTPATKEETKTLGLTSTTTTNSYYNGNISLSNLSEGVYALSFKFFDKNGREKTYPENNEKFYFAFDQTSPAIDAPSIKAVAPKTSSLDVTWSPSGDVKEALVQYKPHSVSDWSNADQFTFTLSDNTTKSLTGLSEGCDYDFKVTYSDFYGNTTVKETLGRLNPIPPANIRLTDYQNQYLTLTWDPSGSCDQYIFKYKEKALSQEIDYQRNAGANDTSISLPVTMGLNCPAAREITIYTEKTTQINGVTVTEKSEVITFNTYTGFIISGMQYTKKTSQLYISVKGFENCKYTVQLKNANGGWTDIGTLEDAGILFCSIISKTSVRVIARFSVNGVNYERISNEREITP